MGEGCCLPPMALVPVVAHRVETGNGESTAKSGAFSQLLSLTTEVMESFGVLSPNAFSNKADTTLGATTEKLATAKIYP